MIDRVANGESGPPRTLVELLRKRALHHPDKLAYIYLQDGESDEVRITYSQLDRRARSIAATLQSLGASGERALLLFPPGLDYLAAYFGCLYAGVVAVPAYPPRLNRPSPRIQGILADAQATLALTVSHILEKLERRFEHMPELAALRWVDTGDISADLHGQWREPEVSPETLAFLQYTSGSTSAPKGVMVSHGNLMHNLAMIRKGFQIDPRARGVFWLPSYHDMGLIGGLLEPMYVNGLSVIMDPAAFLQRPVRWLQALMRYEGTISGAPNFAYQLCVDKVTPEQCTDLDLSTWRIAFCGAEPVRAKTLAAFAEKFALYGFRAVAFYPCYGMAESTLLVSGGDGPAQQAVIRRALSDAGAAAADLDYVEAHGTGTSLGDPIEVQSLRAVLEEEQAPESCYLGSVKTNVGHLEAAAGIAGLIKVVLALQHEEIPPPLHFKELNPYISLDGSPLVIAAQGHAWPRCGRRRLAGVSSFGFGGTNAHVVVGDAPLEIRGDRGRLAGLEMGRSPEVPTILPLSARSEQALSALVQGYLLFLHEGEEVSLPDVCYTADAPGAWPMSLEELNAEVVLDEAIDAGGREYRPAGSPQHFFLTGATGFLGACLLNDLLWHTEATVHCLVRAADEASALARLRRNLQSYDVWDEAFAERIVALPGDLARPRLGLDEEYFARLARDVDAIYHNGALVNFVYPYAAHKAVNVLGTQEVLRLAATGRLKPVHFVSTLSVFHTDEHDDGAVYKEDDELREVGAPFGGYAQSKWVAEKVVMTAAERGIPVAIYRPGMVSGHSRSGAWNAEDMMTTLARASLALGVVPDLDTEEKTTVVDVVPVDYVSRAIVELLQQPRSLGQTFHLNNPKPLSCEELLQWARSLGVDVQTIPFERWRERLMALALQAGGNGAAPFLPLLEEVTVEQIFMPAFDCRNTLKGLAGGDVACPPVGPELLRTYLAFFERQGFLRTPLVKGTEGMRSDGGNSNGDGKLGAAGM